MHALSTRHLPKLSLPFLQLSPLPLVSSGFLSLQHQCSYDFCEYGPHLTSHYQFQLTVSLLVGQRVKQGELPAVCPRSDAHLRLKAVGGMMNESSAALFSNTLSILAGIKLQRSLWRG